MKIVKQLLTFAIAGFVVGNSDVFAAARDYRGAQTKSHAQEAEDKRAARRVVRGFPAYIEAVELPDDTNKELVDFGFADFGFESTSSNVVGQKTRVVDVDTKTTAVSLKPWYRGFCQAILSRLISNS